MRYSVMERVKTSHETFLQECRTGWLLLENDFGGKLTNKEKLKYALQCTGRNPSQKSVDKYWTQCGGGVTFTQFCGIMRRERQPSLEELLALFKRVDRSGEGLISATELTKILTKKGEPMSQSEAQAIINGLDLNKDGKLDCMEFCQLVIDTSEDCLSAAHLKAQEREQELEDLRREKRKWKGAEETGRRRSAERHLYEEVDKGVESRKTKKKRSKKPEGNNYPAVLYPTGSQDIEGSDAHSGPEDDTSSDLPDITPTSVEAMSPLSSIPLNDNMDGPEISEPSEDSRTVSDGGKNTLSQITVPEDNVTKNEGKGSIGSGDGSNNKTHEEKESKKGPEQLLREGSEDNDKESSIAEEVEEEMGGVEKEKREEPDSGEEPPGSEDVDAEKKKGDSGTVNSKDSTGKRQPNHLSQSASGPSQEEGVNTTAMLMSSAPKPPKNLDDWNSIQGKGCFYLLPSSSDDDDGSLLIQSHQYALTLTSPSHIWVEMSPSPPGDPLTDTGLYIFHMNKQEEPTELITFTQHFINGSKWVCRLDLEGGTYALLPYTSGCRLQPSDDEINGADRGEVPLTDEKEGRIVLTPNCINALKEIFARHDLDGNGTISRNEFDFFHERTSKEVCDDDSWKVLEDNFDHNEDGELTLKGFLDLHEMTANDEEGGEAELWTIMEAMGYNRQLKLNKACPFLFEIFTQECDGEVEILPMALSSKHVDPALCQLARGRGLTGTVRGGGKDVVAHSLVTSHLTTIVIENKLSRKCLVQVDCSQSKNYCWNRDSAICVLGVGPNSMEIAYQLLSKDPKMPSQVVFVASLVKS